MEAFEGGGSDPRAGRIPMYVWKVCQYVQSVRVFCTHVCLGSEQKRDGWLVGDGRGVVPGMSQPCTIRIDQMLSKKFSLMLILFM